MLIKRIKTAGDDEIAIRLLGQGIDRAAVASRARIGDIGGIGNIDIVLVPCPVRRACRLLSAGHIVKKNCQVGGANFANRCARSRAIRIIQLKQHVLVKLHQTIIEDRDRYLLAVITGCGSRRECQSAGNRGEVRTGRGIIRPGLKREIVVVVIINPVLNGHRLAGIAGANNTDNCIAPAHVLIHPEGGMFKIKERSPGREGGAQCVDDSDALHGINGWRI